MVYRNYLDDKVKLKTFINEYYDDSEGHKNYIYQDQLTKIYEREQEEIRVKLDHVKEYDEDLCQAIEANVVRYQKLLYQALDEMVFNNGVITIKDTFDVLNDHRLKLIQRLHNGENNFDENTQIQPLTIDDVRKRIPIDLFRRFEAYFVARKDTELISFRNLRGQHCGKLSKVKAIVSSVSQRRLLAQVVTYICDKCGVEAYQEVLNNTFMPLVNCKSEHCIKEGSNGGTLHEQTHGSKYIPTQELKLQETQEQVPIGDIPARSSVICRGVNTSLVLPGDSVYVTAVLIPKLQSNNKTGVIYANLVADSYLDAHTIEIISKDDYSDISGFDNSEPTQEEITNLRDPEMYSLLARSIAPEIYGHDDIKKALLIMMARGSKVDSEAMKIRGELNVCLMGDPGVAKSQMLGFVDRLCPRSQYTTGKGSSGVGLTAALVKDPLTNTMTLEGGSLVLADGGICCIDEFDKMSETDRTYIHEVMEQQTISVAKAGIHTTLNARVSILAAANPAFGRYNPKRSLEHNINLPAALLSRFDLLFLIRDVPDRVRDQQMAKHISYVHMYNKAPEKVELQNTQLNMNQLRRYLNIIRQQPDPIVPCSLCDYIKSIHVTQVMDSFKSTNQFDGVFTSTRSLLALLRISTGLARIHCRNEVTRADIDEAIRLVESSKSTVSCDGDNNNRHGAKNDASSAQKLIYQAIRRMARETDSVELKMSEVLEKCIALGYSSEQVFNVIKFYENLNIWMVNVGKTRLTMVN